MDRGWLSEEEELAQRFLRRETRSRFKIRLHFGAASPHIDSTNAARLVKSRKAACER